MLIFWAQTNSGPVGRHQRFGGTYCLHIRGRRALRREVTVGTSSSNSDPGPQCMNDLRCNDDLRACECNNDVRDVERKHI